MLLIISPLQAIDRANLVIQHQLRRIILVQGNESGLLVGNNAVDLFARWLVRRFTESFSWPVDVG